MDTLPVFGRSYEPRLVDPLVTESLATAGAVLIEGPRACGKSMTGLNAAASYALLDDTDTADLARVAPAAVLEGSRPRLLDEWPAAPQLWNLVRRRVDRSGVGQFILTGSAVPADDDTRHTGAGRILRLRLRTKTWQEKTGATSPGVSLAGLFDGQSAVTDLDTGMAYEAVLDELVRPGFPELGGLPPARAQRMLRAYIDEIARADAPRLANLRHDPVVMRRLVSAIARSTASDVSYAALATDVRAVAPAITAETVAVYVGVLERLFVVEPQEAWTPELRSRARLRTSPKLHLADPGLAAVGLGVDATGLARDPRTAGLLFESAVVHDVSVLAGLLDGEVRHFRDSNGHEIDAVVLLPDGRWGAVEVKLGGGEAPEGAASLVTAVRQIDAASCGEPAFRLVVTGTGQTYTMTDGTVTCPLAALRP